MIRVVIDGKVYVTDRVQVKTFDKKIKPIITDSGIGKYYVFQDKELPSAKFRTVMKNEA